MFNSRERSKRPLQRQALARPTRSSADSSRVTNYAARYSNTTNENQRLYEYESKTKDCFDKIENVLRDISAMQHESDFAGSAQNLAKAQLGFALPEQLLKDCWIKPLDIGQLYVWCVFETFRRFSEEFFIEQPLVRESEEDFQHFLQSCGFHTIDVSPCADGRLAHVISYVLRLPYKAVRRKSYAGAMFDVEDSLQKWVETEMLRHREGKPNLASDDTRYLKIAAYHFSSVMPEHEGCAAHGSDVQLAAAAAQEKLLNFRQGVENSFCCGASIDLLLIGLDTDTDSIRIHVPNAEGNMEIDSYIDTLTLYQQTNSMFQNLNEQGIVEYLEKSLGDDSVSSPRKGMLKLIARLIHGNLQQVDYVKRYHGGNYQDIGHQERFIGMGIGFEEIQLRNLTYFSYLKTVEEGAKDLDVGIKIFTGLNIRRGLPVPVIIRYDYHGLVPGARARAESRCQQLETALKQRYADLADQGYIHTLLMVRDCNSDTKAEVIGCSVSITSEALH